MRSSPAPALVAVVVLVAHVHTAAYAADRAISAKSIKLQRKGDTAKLVFTSRDASFPFPAIGGPDDPSSGGATIEIFSASEGSAVLAIPPGVGTPGWKVSAGAQPSFKFKNVQAPAGPSVVGAMVLKQGKVVKLKAKDHGLPLAVPAGSIGIRITTGSLRSCALFDADTVGRDEPGRFSASNASAARPVDCSDASLLGAEQCDYKNYPDCDGGCAGGGVCFPDGFFSCVCVDPTTPCGENDYPACGGACPSGEECAVLGNGSQGSCGCIPEGATPCGEPDAPTCGGACPSGGRCSTWYDAPADGGLACGCGWNFCPEGSYYVASSGSEVCVPIRCDGGAAYPVCGGGCQDGTTCHPVASLPPVSSDVCVCADETPCSSGGVACPDGQACVVSVSSYCVPQ